MLLFLVLVAGIWTLGHYMKAPRSARWLMICLLYVVVLALQVVLPEGNAVREVFGGSATEWAVVGVIGVLVWVYGIGLAKLRARVRPENRPQDALPPRRKAASNATPAISSCARSAGRGRSACARRRCW
jgi:K+ transporter